MLQDVIDAHENVLRRDTGPTVPMPMAGFPIPRESRAPDPHERRRREAADAEARRAAEWAERQAEGFTAETDR